ncbi:MAG: L-lactate dehydrogenase complex protein LldE [Thermodesulfobacteriota bacterium]|nr:L-lactate dehydrogenase complex protein LldE [Thermodesulfobacteriota bacterium]
MRVQLFATCLIDTFFPETGEAIVKILRHFDVDIVYPKEQTCCGKPPNSAGYRKEARQAAEHFISVYEGSDPIVIPSGSCASMVKNHYPELFKDDPKMFRKAESVARRTFEFSQFLTHVLKANETEFPNGHGKITYHASCQLTRELGVKTEPLDLIKSIHGAEFVPMTNADRCCGFGGVFMGKLPEISMALADDKVDSILETNADIVTGCDHGCLMNIMDAAKRRNSSFKVKHLAAVLAEAL